MPALSDERLLSMSAFEAALLLRRFRVLNSSYSDEQLVESIRAIRADFFPNDYEAGLSIEKAIPSVFDGSADPYYFRAAIEWIIEHCKPLWTRFAVNGRDFV